MLHSLSTKEKNLCHFWLLSSSTPKFNISLRGHLQVLKADFLPYFSTYLASNEKESILHNQLDLSD